MQIHYDIPIIPIIITQKLHAYGITCYKYISYSYIYVCVYTVYSTCLMPTPFQPPRWMSANTVFQAVSVIELRVFPLSGRPAARRSARNATAARCETFRLGVRARARVCVCAQETFRGSRQSTCQASVRLCGRLRSFQDISSFCVV